MGAGASSVSLPALDQDAFQRMAPDHFTVSLFNSIKDYSTGVIPPARLMKFTSEATDCFLTHDWGKDELGRDNHARVGRLNGLLKARGFRTWFDEEMMRGDIQQKMADGIEHAACVVVFITVRYMEKVAGKGEKGELDNCLFEFSHLSTSKARSKLFPVVMEPRCRDTATWFGKVKFVLGNQLYTDYCSDDNVDAVANDLANKIRQVLTDGRTVDERLSSLSMSPASISATSSWPSDSVSTPVHHAPSAPAVPSGYVFTSNGALKEAVDMWCQDEGSRAQAEAKYGHISTWQTGQITSMKGLFSSKTTFNDDISSWDVSNVTDMHGMFEAALVFNQPIGRWNVSKVSKMSYMFKAAKAFNQPIGTWDVSNVTNMSNMFQNAESFNQPIGTWNVSNVTNMESVFNCAGAFNQPLNNWSVGRVTRMPFLFYGAAAFNQPIGSWDVSSVSNMWGVFDGARAFNQPVGSWNVSNVTNMKFMFHRTEAFNQVLGTWNVSSVTDMTGMFKSAKAFNQPVDNWDVSQVTSMTDMFSDSGYTHKHPEK